MSARDDMSSTSNLGSRSILVSNHSSKGQNLFHSKMGFRARIKQKLQVKNQLARECLAEFIGTFILMVSIFI